MAYDEGLAERIHAILANSPGLDEKRMFGGVGFMILGNLACGVNGTDLIVRVGPAGYEDALAALHARPFDLTGRSMKGWTTIGPEGLDSEEALERWIRLGVKFALSLPPK